MAKIELVTIEVPEAWERLLVKNAQRTGKSIGEILMDRGVKEVVLREAIDAIDAMVTKGEEIPAEIIAAAETR